MKLLRHQLLPGCQGRKHFNKMDNRMLGFFICHLTLKFFCPWCGSCCGINGGGCVNIFLLPRLSLFHSEWSQPFSHTFHECILWEEGRNWGRFQPFRSLHQCPKSQLTQHAIWRGNWLSMGTRLQARLLATTRPPPPNLTRSFLYKKPGTTSAVPALSMLFLPEACSMQEMSKALGFEDGIRTMNSLSLPIIMTKCWRIDDIFCSKGLWNEEFHLHHATIYIGKEFGSIYEILIKRASPLTKPSHMPLVPWYRFKAVC